MPLDQELLYVREYLENIYQILATSSEKTLPLTKTLILASTEHWSACALEFTVTNGRPAIKMFFLDSTGLQQWGETEDLLIKAISEIFDKSNITIYRSSVQLQKDGRSCKAFSLTFTRMLHSMHFGKFSENFDLFASLSENLQQVHYKITPIHGIDVCEVAAHLSAKLLQTSQYLYPTKPTELIHYSQLAEQFNAPVNSKGTQLKEIINNYGLINQKINEKFLKMVENSAQIFDTIPHEQRAQLLQEIIHKYSSKNLVTKKSWHDTKII